MTSVREKAQNLFRRLVSAARALSWSFWLLAVVLAYSLHRVSELQDEIYSLEGSSYDLESQVEELTPQNDELQSEIQSLQLDLELLESSVRSLRYR